MNPMMILSNTINFDPVSGMIGGQLTATNDSAAEQLLSVDIPLPSLTFSVAWGGGNGFGKFKAVAPPGEAVWVKAAGGAGIWSYAICVPLASDLNEDGVVTPSEFARSSASKDSNAASAKKAQ